MGYLYIHVHDSITDNSQKMQLKCPSLNEWVNKMWCEQTVEHYSPLKWKEILTPVTTWLNLEDIMLSEISHSGHLRRQIFRKLRSWHPVPSLHANRWGNNGNSERLYFLGPKSLWTVTEAIKLKDTCFVEEKL